MKSNRHFYPLPRLSPLVSGALPSSAAAQALVGYPLATVRERKNCPYPRPCLVLNPVSYFPKPKPLLPTFAASPFSFQLLSPPKFITDGEPPSILRGCSHSSLRSTHMRSYPIPSSSSRRSLVELRLSAAALVERPYRRIVSPPCCCGEIHRP